jgi:hypothetical protein
MASVAREAFALLLQSIDSQEQEQQTKARKGQQQRQASPTFLLPADAASLASLAWGLHKAGHCNPVQLDALALLLPGDASLAVLQPEEALRLLSACEAACTAATRTAAAAEAAGSAAVPGDEAAGARQLLEGLAAAVAGSVQQYGVRQAVQVATHMAATDYFDEHLMR